MPPRGPNGQPPRGPMPPQGGQPPRRPGPPPRPGNPDATRKLPNPADPDAKVNTGARQAVPNHISRAATSDRTQRVSDRAVREGGAGTRPRPAEDRNRPPSGAQPATRRPQNDVPAGPPPRRPGGNGSGGNGQGGRGTPQKKKSSAWRIVRRVAYLAIALVFGGMSSIFLYAYSTVNVPQPGDMKNNQVATIFMNDGSSVLAKVIPPEGNRTDVTIDQIPPHVRNAVIAAEDRSFYTNPGFSIQGFGRAIWGQVTGDSTAGGGSTITQQYVKNAMVGNEHSLTRKLRELVISAKMAKQWAKDQILAAYLNTIYFGRGAYGIDAAAKAYFNKPVSELTVAEGAVLAATIQQPSNLDPEKNPDGAQTRWKYVLDGMVDGGNLSAADRQNMQYPAVIPAAQAQKDKTLDAGPEGLIKTQVLKELEAAGITEHDLNTEGLQITTTIDPKAQQAAVDAVNKVMDGEPEKLRTAVVSVDPKTGSVRAYYGGSDGQGLDYANQGLPPGSSFKVFGLAENLELGKPLSTLYDSSPVTVNGIKITNVEGEQCGMCTIAEALKRSLNTSFYRMELDMQGNGPQKIADMAHKLGIPQTIPGVGKSLTEPDGSGPNNGIVLGQYQVRPLDMASAYATLAASGMYRAPHFVQKVVASDGTVLLDRGDPAGEQRVSAAVADNVTDAMKPIAQWSRNHQLSGGRLSATKTGTNQLGDTGENRDSWMVGYTPSLSTAVWVGTDNGEKLRNANGGMIYGSGLPADIWKATMDGALKGTPNENFPKPGTIGGQAGVPSWSAPYTPPSTTEQAPQMPVLTQSQVEILPGITIPVPGLAPNPNNQRQSTPQPQQQNPQEGPMSGQPVAPADGSTPTTSPNGGNGNGNGNGNGPRSTR
ncbi:transglycosylase domain-containing protein [Nocardia seriolae]|uniref:transglycosylase domain-containing protein n=2 Tax=Nocardia seriolae TaxID=37332 RepID=UPI00090C06CD|nr:transglycosylase domain-containing protein [Nocardia seriolae]MTJ66885.1 penicillin-binding protein [Nocardia seriolae]MTJ72542.1 penicillin-binding protein [Nocardia seriolae]MTK28864.1 penicillin-binding protein [Nocardia seriolae]MTK45432.1 penicillin-binding protein [Nocardia seriolae]BAW10729.1 penicillin-binding protein [Nocardia seriolae]